MLNRRFGSGALASRTIATDMRADDAHQSLHPLEKTSTKPPAVLQASTWVGAYLARG
jgi:hypothetical protein